MYVIFDYTHHRKTPNNKRERTQDGARAMDYIYTTCEGALRQVM